MTDLQHVAFLQRVTLKLGPRHDEQIEAWSDQSSIFLPYFPPVPVGPLWHSPNATVQMQQLRYVRSKSSPLLFVFRGDDQPIENPIGDE